MDFSSIHVLFHFVHVLVTDSFKLITLAAWDTHSVSNLLVTKIA